MSGEMTAQDWLDLATEYLEQATAVRDRMNALVDAANRLREDQAQHITRAEQALAKATALLETGRQLQ